MPQVCQYEMQGLPGHSMVSHKVEFCLHTCPQPPPAVTEVSTQTPHHQLDWGLLYTRHMPQVCQYEMQGLPGHSVVSHKVEFRWRNRASFQQKQLAEATVKPGSKRSRCVFTEWLHNTSNYAWCVHMLHLCVCITALGVGAKC
jgi:hypothetical protein